MPSDGVYLYCFSRPGDIPPLTGLDGISRVIGLEVEDVQAVYSPLNLAEFEEFIALQSPDWLIPGACHHEKVVATLMAGGPVLPVRFGAVFSGPAPLEEYLTRWKKDIASFLEDIAGKEEWAVKGSLDLNRAEEWLLANDVGLANQWRQLADTPGTRYFQEKKLRAGARRQAQAWGRDQTREIQDRLQTLALDFCPVKIANPKGLNGEAAFHGAFLLPARDVSEFQTAFTQLALAQGPRGMILKLSGPWPPYHFCPALESSNENTP